MQQGNRLNLGRIPKRAEVWFMGDLSMELFPMAVASLLDHFSALGDPQQSWKLVCPLPEFLLVILCEAMARTQNIVETRQWAGPRLAFLPFGRNMPPHDTLCGVLDAATFSACFTAWVASLADAAAEIVATDGQTSRRAHGVDAHPRHVVSAWALRPRCPHPRDSRPGGEDRLSNQPGPRLR
jgi:hypothetical protein